MKFLCFFILILTSISVFAQDIQAEEIIVRQPVTWKISPTSSDYDFKCKSDVYIGYRYNTQITINTNHRGTEDRPFPFADADYLTFKSEPYGTQEEENYKDCADFDFFLKNKDGWVLKGFRDVKIVYSKLYSPLRCLKAIRESIEMKVEGADMKFYGYSGITVGYVDMKYCH